MYESKNTRLVENREVNFCRLCGDEIVRLTLADGTPYWTDVHRANGGGRFVILGEGNHYNYKPNHACVKRAANDLRLAEAEYAEFMKQYEAAKATVEQVRAADKQMAENPTACDEKTTAIVNRLRDSAEENLRQLEARKPSKDDYVTTLRARATLLSEGKSILPADRAAYGRLARVTGGKKLPHGTEGRIIWMGLNNFDKGVRRVGIEVNGQRHFISENHVTIVTEQPTATV